MAQAALKRVESPPIRLVEFTRAFYVGGTEGQLVELLRGLGEGFEVQLSALEAKGQYFEQVQKLGFAPKTFPLAGSFMHPRTATNVVALSRWLRQERIDLVHAHDFYATLVAVPAARMAGVRVVVSRLDLAHWHGRARRAALAMMTRWADQVVVNADAIRRQLLDEERLPAERVTVVHNGLDLARFDARLAAPLDAPLPDAQGATVVVHVANMNHPVKRQEDLLEAIAGVPAEVGLRAWLIGDGPRRPQLEARAQALGVADRVSFLGHRRDVPAVLARAQIGVLCSNAEGLSNAVMEGMAARLPMVVTRVGGNPELVAHLQRGFVVEPHRPDALRQAFVMLAQSPALRARLGEAARDHVARTLTLGQMVDGHARVYRAVVSR